MQIPLSLRRSAPPGTLVASKLKLQSEKVKEFFDKPIKTICAHIQKMISAMPLDELKTILLVGGFSESKLLQEGIQWHFPSIAVRTPSGPSTAIVKGAVDFGHCPEKIVSECLRIRMVLAKQHHFVMVYTPNESYISFRAQSIVVTFSTFM
jgi:molecular chaperone DnaK (HSP70)